MSILEKFFKWLFELFVTPTPKAPALPKADAKPIDETRILRLTRTRSMSYNDLEGLKLALVRKGDNKELDSIITVSGQSYAQTFRLAASSKAGSMEPVPEGYYDLGPVEWAHAKGDYGSNFSAALGPVWISVNPTRTMVTGRSEIGIHLDANKLTSPGTAGCIGISNISDLKKVVSWFDDAKLKPKSLTVNYNLGSVETKLNS